MAKSPNGTAVMDVALTQPMEALALVEHLEQIAPHPRTRAHLLLTTRGELTRQLHAGAEAACAALGEQLGCSVRARARLLEAVIIPARSLGCGSGFAIIELGAVGKAAALEVELPWLVVLIERLSGQRGKLAPASTLTRIEEVAFGFLCLCALSAFRSQEALGRLFAPRVVSVETERAAALVKLERHEPHLVVEVLLMVGEAAVPARLLVPAAAVEAQLRREDFTPAGVER